LTQWRSTVLFKSIKTRDHWVLLEKRQKLIPIF
jgi:hypothetical protein